MELLPAARQAMVIRTDFSDDEVWRVIEVGIQELTPEGFCAFVDVVDDRAYEGLGKEELLGLVPEGYGFSFLMVVDDVTVREPEHPVLVVALRHERGREFRATPRAVQSVENNLSLANMDFHEFADNVGADGVFRGF
jgi:hypothetical protein